MINTILGFIYLSISTLPLFLLLASSVKVLLLTSLFTLIVSIFYRGYIKIHVWDFEFKESIPSNIMALILTSISLIISYYFLRTKYLFIFNAIPLLIEIYFIYIFVVFDFLDYKKDRIFLKTLYSHINKTVIMVELFIVFKLILLAFLSIININVKSPYPWFLSFFMDIFVIIIQMQRLNSIKNIVEIEHDNKRVLENRIWGVIIILIASVLSLTLPSGAAILPYTTILKFLQSIYFVKKTKEGNVFDNQEEVLKSKNSENIEFDPNIFKLVDESVVLHRFWIILGYVVIGLSVLVAIYFTLYKFVSPQFRKGRRFYLKSFIASLLDGIGNFFKSLSRRDFSHTHSITIKNRSIKLSRDSRAIKERETSKLLKEYITLVRWYNKRMVNSIDFRTVDEFFALIPLVDKGLLNRLNLYFNISFYSDTLLGDDKVQEISSMVKEISKNRKLAK